MPDYHFQPTPYRDVNERLAELWQGVQTILSPGLVGLYLHGSLALGDFNPNTSDIDFVIVTEDEVTGEQASALQNLHTRLAASGWPLATELEGSYISRQALRRYQPNQDIHPHIERGGTLRVEQHDWDWVIQRYILREFGVAVVGPPPIDLIDPISPAELHQATVNLLMSWWRPMLEDPFRLIPAGYRTYAILTMCRMLYTFRHETVVSKPVAARWALSTLDGRWSGLIRAALEWDGVSQVGSVEEVVAWIRFTIEEGRKNDGETGRQGDGER